LTLDTISWTSSIPAATCMHTTKQPLTTITISTTWLSTIQKSTSQHYTSTREKSQHSHWKISYTGTHFDKTCTTEWAICCQSCWWTK
jgi:hypothetical protein